MPVGSPRVGTLDAFDQMAIARARRRPQAECAVDVNPSAVSLSNRNQGFEGIVSAGIHVASLEEHERGSRAVSFERTLQILEGERSTSIRRNQRDLRETQTEQAHCAFKSAVPLIACQNADCGRAEKTAPLDIPPALREQAAHAARLRDTSRAPSGSQ